jgi:hypothetical protein
MLTMLDSSVCQGTSHTESVCGRQSRVQTGVCSLQRFPERVPVPLGNRPVPIRIQAISAMGIRPFLPSQNLHDQHSGERVNKDMQLPVRLHRRAAVELHYSTGACMWHKEVASHTTVHINC